MKKQLQTIILITIIACTGNTYAQWITNGPSGETVRALASDGVNTFAGTANGTVFLSTNNGGSWSSVTPGLPANSGLFSLAISGTKIFAGVGCCVGGGVYSSVNNGSTWTILNTGINVQGQVYALAASGNNIFAGTDGAGIYYSANNGTTWNTVNTGLVNKSVNCIAINEPYRFDGTAHGMYLSTNNGSTWSTLNTGLSSLNPGIYSIAINGSTIIAATDSGIIKSTDNGSTWAPSNTGLTNTSNTAARSLAFTGNRFFAGTLTDGVFLSTNNCSTWTVENNGLTNTSIFSFAIGGANIFAGSGGSGVFTRPLSELTSVTENTKDDGFIISPNPATTQFTINFLEEQQNTIINIIDITGRIVNNKLLLANGKTATVDMIDYAKGVYFVQITDANKNVVNRKVVVE